MPSLSVHELARRYVAKIPPAVSGSGGHNQTFTVACALVKGFDLSVDEARPIIEEYNNRCEPPWSAAELHHKLVSADGTADAQPRGWLRLQDVPDGAPPAPRRSYQPEPKPIFRNEKLAKFAARWREHVNTAWLADRSPVMPYGLSSSEFLAHLYRPGEKVVIFTNQQSQGQALWPGERPPPRGPHGVWYLAQPVDGKTYPNPRNLDEQGRPIPSRRSEESVTSWRFLIIESDEADARDWMAALVQFPLRIAAVYTSGGRSIHALVQLDAPSKHEWDEMVKQVKAILITLGACPKSLSAVRLTRLPGCYRGSKLQKLLYLNPSPAAAPICSLPRVRDVLGPIVQQAAVHASAAGDVIASAKARSLDDVVAALEKAELLRAQPLDECRRILSWFESSPLARAALDRIGRDV